MRFCRLSRNAAANDVESTTQLSTEDLIASNRCCKMQLSYTYRELEYNEDTGEGLREGKDTKKDTRRRADEQAMMLLLDKDHFRQHCWTMVAITRVARTTTPEFETKYREDDNTIVLIMQIDGGMCAGVVLVRMNKNTWHFAPNSGRSYELLSRTIHAMPASRYQNEVDAVQNSRASSSSRSI